MLPEYCFNTGRERGMKGKAKNVNPHHLNGSKWHFFVQVI